MSTRALEILREHKKKLALFVSDPVKGDWFILGSSEDQLRQIWLRYFSLPNEQVALSKDQGRRPQKMGQPLEHEDPGREYLIPQTLCQGGNHSHSDDGVDLTSVHDLLIRLDWGCYEAPGADPMVLVLL